MSDFRGTWTQSPLGVLTAVATGLERAGTQYRDGLVVVLGEHALRELRPDDDELDNQAIEADLVVLEALFVGMEKVLLGFSRDEAHADRVYVVCTGVAGSTFTSEFRLPEKKF